MKEKNENMFRGRTARSMVDPGREERKLRLKKQYDERYNKLKIIEFKTMEEVNMNKHFYLPKHILEKGLSKRALALYPVLCSFADFRERKWFQLSTENLVKFSGMSRATIYQALPELENKWYKYTRSDDPQGYDPNMVPFIERKKETKGKRHYNLYKVEFYRGGTMDANKGKFWVYNTMIIETGIWAKLSISAKALYMYMRANAEVLICDYEEWQDLNADGGFRNRKHDSMVLNLTEISTNLKIKYDNVKNAIQELEDSGLCMRAHEYCLVGLTAMDEAYYFD